MLPISPRCAWQHEHLRHPVCQYLSMACSRNLSIILAPQPAHCLTLFVEFAFIVAAFILGARCPEGAIALPFIVRGVVDAGRAPGMQGSTVDLLGLPGEPGLLLLLSGLGAWSCPATPITGDSPKRSVLPRWSPPSAAEAVWLRPPLRGSPLLTGTATKRKSTPLDTWLNAGAQINDKSCTLRHVNNGDTINTRLEKRPNDRRA